jgi:hypothetical protein
MKTYTALVKAYVGKSLRALPTEIRAASSTDARWMLQAIFGFHAVVSAPTEVHASANESVIKPLTPDQQRVENLKTAKDRASDALKVERDRQKRAKAMKTITSIKPISTP